MSDIMDNRILIQLSETVQISVKFVYGNYILSYTIVCMLLWRIPLRAHACGLIRDLPKIFASLAVKIISVSFKIYD